MTEVSTELEPTGYDVVATDGTTELHVVRLTPAGAPDPDESWLVRAALDADTERRLRTRVRELTEAQGRPVGARL